MKTPLNIFVGDDSQIPQLLLNLGGSISPNTRFYTDFYLWTPMMGGGMSQNVKGLNLGVSLTGTHDFDKGTLQIQTGGINWYALTPFTFHSNPGFNRFTVFERNPWDPMTRNAMDRYQTFYQTGAMNQDTRWGRQAFQGLILEGSNLPHGFSAAFMYGKTQLNGGMTPLPNHSVGGKIKNGNDNRYISINTFNIRRIQTHLLAAPWASPFIPQSLPSAKRAGRFMGKPVQDDIIVLLTIRAGEKPFR
jgi:hypothetical protein